MFLIFIIEIMLLLFSLIDFFFFFFFFLNILCRLYELGGMKTFSPVKSFFFFFLILLDDIFFICINCCTDYIYDNFKFKYYLLLECMDGLFMDM
jgi:hypothetical protein